MDEGGRNYLRVCSTTAQLWIFLAGTSPRNRDMAWGNTTKRSCHAVCHAPAAPWQTRTTKPNVCIHARGVTTQRKNTRPPPSIHVNTAAQTRRLDLRQLMPPSNSKKSSHTGEALGCPMRRPSAAMPAPAGLPRARAWLDSFRTAPPGRSGSGATSPQTAATAEGAGASRLVACRRACQGRRLLPLPLLRSFALPRRSVAGRWRTVGPRLTTGVAATTCPGVELS